MKTVKIMSGKDHFRDIETPETWEEAHEMLTEAMGAMYSASGGDAHRNSVAGRVVYGMFGDATTPNPTTALNFLLQKICERKGAGLDQ
jgi:hypothetical protein